MSVYYGAYGTEEVATFRGCSCALQCSLNDYAAKLSLIWKCALYILRLEQILANSFWSVHSLSLNTNHMPHYPKKMVKRLFFLMSARLRHYSITFRRCGPLLGVMSCLRDTLLRDTFTGRIQPSEPIRGSQGCTCSKAKVSKIGGSAPARSKFL